MIRTYVGSITSAEANPDNETLQISSGVLSVKNNSISTKKISDNHRTAYVNLSLRNTFRNTTSPSSTSNWRSVCWSPELKLFNAIGSGVNYSNITSSNGTNWSVGSPALGQSPYAVIWSAQFNSFFSVGETISSGRSILKSLDGITWSTQTYTGVPLLYSIADAPELGILCTLSTGSNAVYTSSDGLSWSRKPVTITGAWKSLAWSADLEKFVGIDYEQPSLAIVGTNNANTWVTQSIPSNSWRSICWSPELGLFCAVANGAANNVLISSDAVSWSSIGVSTPLLSVCWSKEFGAFFAGGNGKILFSFNGITWNEKDVVGTSHNSIVWSPELGLLCIAGNGYTSISL
jgi:hypothetical protein